MEMIFKSIYRSVIILSLFAVGCTRPLECVSDSCDNDVAGGSAGAAVASTPTGTATSTSTTAPNASADAAAQGMAKQMEGLKMQMQLQGMISKLAAKLTDIDQQHLERLRSGVDEIVGLRDKMAAEQVTQGRLLEAYNAKKAVAGGKLLEQLNTFAADREAQRLSLYKQLEELEIAILDPLTPEGLAAQVQWDSYFAKLDVVRELSVKDEILKTKDEMLKAVAATYAADKGALTTMVNAIIDTNLALVDANAPANAARVLSKLIALETELQLAVGPDAGELRESLAKQIEATQKNIKLPLDAIDPKLFGQLVALVTDVKTAEGTIAGLGEGIATVEGFAAEQREAVAAIKKAFTAVQSATSTLSVVPVEFAANGAIVGDSVGTTMAVLDQLAGAFEEIAAGLATLPSADLKAGFPAEAAAKLAQGEAKIVAALKLVSQSLENLAKLAAAKAACTQGESSTPEGVPMRDMLCGDTITVISSQ